MDKFKLEDLAVLQYAPNNCYVQVIDLKDAISNNECFNVDTDKGIWNYKHWQNISIGRSRSIFDSNSNKCRSGIIGVYDRTKTEHLSLMAHDSVEFLSENNFMENRLC